MKKIIIILAVAFSSLSTFAQEEVTTYYLIRHAEKKKDAKDPGISNEGIQRTKKWLQVFSNVKFDAVYSTDYKRTKQTAKQIADANGLGILGYDPRNMYDEGFKYNTTNKTVLVVGHSNTTPFFANKILGKEEYKQLDESVYGNLYIVKIIDGKASSLLLSIN